MLKKDTEGLPPDEWEKNVESDRFVSMLWQDTHAIGESASL